MKKMQLKQIMAKTNFRRIFFEIKIYTNEIIPVRIIIP